MNDTQLDENTFTQEKLYYTAINLVLKGVDEADEGGVGVLAHQAQGGASPGPAGQEFALFRWLHLAQHG